MTEKKERTQEQRDRQKVYAKKWLDANKEAAYARIREWNLANIDHCREYYRDYRDQHREKIREYNREYMREYRRKQKEAKIAALIQQNASQQ